MPTLNEKLQLLAEIKDPNLKIQRIIADRAIAEAIVQMDKVVGPMGPEGPEGKSIVGPKGDKGEDSTVPGPRGESIVGPRGPEGPEGKSIVGPKGDKGDKGKDATPLDIGKIKESVFAEIKAKPIQEIANLTDLVDFLKRGGFRGGGGGSGGSVSPLTTKGDIYTYSNANTRLSVGADGQALTADSTQATGLKWVTLGAGTGDMILAANQTVTGLKTFTDGKFALQNTAGTFSGLFTNTNTANRTYTLKDSNGTIAFTSDLTGYVTAIGVTTANGVSGSSSGGATPNLTLTLGAITPTSVNGTTSTEIGYVSGVTSSIQTQLNSKGSGTVTSVTGTTNRITSSGGATPAIDISASYVGQTSITTLGTIGTGVWNGTAIGDTYISSAATWNAKQGAITLTTSGTSGVATLSAGTLNIPNYAGGGSSTATFTDQTPDNGSYGLLGGSVNSSNTVFTASQGSYSSGTLTVYRNGQLLTQGASNDFQETTPASGTFTFITAPATGDVITVQYQTTASTSGGIVVKDEGTTLTSTLASMNFVGAGVTATNTGGAVTVTIPSGISASSTDTLTNKTIIASTNIVEEMTTTTSSSTPTPTGGSLRNFFSVTALATGATFGAPTGTPADNNILTIRIKDNGTARTLAFNAIYRFGTDVPAPTTTVISKTMYINFRYNGADSKWDCVATVGTL